MSKRRSHRRIKNLKATVIGLGGVGRQVAIQLACLGVGSLQLVDHRAVSSRSQRQEGYSNEDIGRARVFAAAQACHAVNPELEVNTYCQRSIRNISLGDIVFCCELPNAVGYALRQAVIADSLDWCAEIHVGKRNIRIESGVKVPTGQMKHTKSHHSSNQRSFDASIASGLAVREFFLFVQAKPQTRSIQFKSVHNT